MASGGGFCIRRGVQQISYIATTAGRYKQSEGHKEVKRPERCFGCGHGKLHRHGSYSRYVVELGVVLLIWVARFLCPACGRTTSCLPSFALPYRLIGTRAVEAFLRGRINEPGIAQHWDLLAAYGRRWSERAPQLEAITGAFFGPLGDEAPPERLLAGILSHWGDLQHAGAPLLELFGETPLGRYRIHDWARVACGSVDPLRKPPYQDSG